VLGNQKKNTESAKNAGSDMSLENTNGDSGVTESSDVSLRAESSSLGLPHLLLLMSFIALVDQIVKAIVVRNLHLHESISVLPGILTITRIHNSGIAFGLFPGMPDIFMVVTLISMLAVLYFYLSVNPRGILLTIGCGLIMGGALGNLIDRFRFKYVVDFVYFSFWPAFNVADSAVTIGVALLMITFFRGEKGVGQDASDTV
jgi:signal peptidase II